MMRLNAIRFSEQDIANISSLLESKEGVSFVCEPQMSGVWFHDEDWEAEVRLLLLADIKLTVSRVIFRNRRQGTMSQLLLILEDFCVRNKVKEIVVQSVETPEMAAWCLKHKFIPNPYVSFSRDDVVYGDYIKKVICDEK